MFFITDTEVMTGNEGDRDVTAVHDLTWTGNAAVHGGLLKPWDMRVPQVSLAFDVLFLLWFNLYFVLFCGFIRNKILGKGM